MKVGTHALVTAHEDLVAKGYKRTNTYTWEADKYGVYEHSELPPVRLYLDTVEAGEHDLEEHEKNVTRI
jgi:hypothetical protein